MRLLRLDVVWLNMSSFCPILFECKLYNSISVHSSVDIIIIYYGLSVRDCSRCSLFEHYLPVCQSNVLKISKRPGWTNGSLGTRLIRVSLGLSSIYTQYVGSYCICFQIVHSINQLCFRASLEGWVSVAPTLNQCVYSQSLSIMMFVNNSRPFAICHFPHK